MSYNKTLQSNNTDLQAILNTINALPEVGGEQATPEISVATSGLITATAGSKSSTYQLAFQAAKTITPSTVSQVAVSSGYYTGGDITVAAVPTQAKSITPTTVTQNVTPDSGKFLSKVTVAGDSNLVAGNIKSGVSIFGVSGTAEAGGGETVVDDVSKAIIERTITEIEDNSIESIGNYAFTSCSSLTTANFPACTSIGNYAFTSCSSLTTANFPACTSIGSYAFGNCSSLTTANFPACTTIGYSAFYSCQSLTTISLPVCTTIGGSAFYTCKSLTTISFPACTTIGNNAFYSCFSLTTVSLPVCTTIGASAFYTCSSLTTISLPVCTTIGTSAFYSCQSLTTISFPVRTLVNYAFYSCKGLTTAILPACTVINNYVFNKCVNLSSLQLGASSVCRLSNSKAFSSTPFAGYSAYFSGTPHIYVPSSLITAYQSATNWTYFSSYFSAIGSEDWNGGDNTESGGDNLITFEINGIQYQAEVGMTISDWVNSGYNIDGWTIQNNNLRDSDGRRYPLPGGVNAVIEQGATF